VVCGARADLALEGPARNGTNASEVSPEFIALMKFIEYNEDEENNNIMASANLEKIKARVARVKASEKVGVRYMQKWEEEDLIRHEALEQGREEGRVEGIEIGIKQGENLVIVQFIKNLMNNMGITAEEAMSNLGIASANYDKYLKML